MRDTHLSWSKVLRANSPPRTCRRIMTWHSPWRRLMCLIFNHFPQRSISNDWLLQFYKHFTDGHFVVQKRFPMDLNRRQILKLGAASAGGAVVGLTLGARKSLPMEVLQCNLAAGRELELDIVSWIGCGNNESITMRPNNRRTWQELSTRTALGNIFRELRGTFRKHRSTRPSSSRNYTASPLILGTDT